MAGHRSMNFARQSTHNFCTPGRPSDPVESADNTRLPQRKPHDSSIVSAISARSVFVEFGKVKAGEKRFSFFPKVVKSFSAVRREVYSRFGARQVDSHTMQGNAQSGRSPTGSRSHPTVDHDEASAKRNPVFQKNRVSWCQTELTQNKCVKCLVSNNVAGMRSSHPQT